MAPPDPQVTASGSLHQRMRDRQTSSWRKMRSQVVEKVAVLTSIFLYVVTAITSQESVEVEVGADTESCEIRDYAVVWARVGGWPWWPGVVSPGTRRRANKLRMVYFFGEDDRGINTHSYLVSEVGASFQFSVHNSVLRMRRTSNHSKRESTSLLSRAGPPAGEESWRSGKHLSRVSQQWLGLTVIFLLCSCVGDSQIAR